jgi:antitoxin ParD1/3/4
VRSGLRLLQEAEERRARFTRMLDDVRAEAAREGDHAVDQVLAEIDAIIAEHDDPTR